MPVYAAFRLRRSPTRCRSHLRISVEEKQDLLETFSVQERLQKLIDVLEAEIEKRQLDRNIHSRTKKQMDKHQREYYLNEQIKAIHKELGRKDEKAELDDLKKKIEEAGMSEEAKDKAMQEFCASRSHAADVGRKHRLPHLS